MFGSTETLVIAAALLVLVASLPAASGRAAWLCLAVWGATLLAAALLFAQGADALGYRVQASTSEVRKYAEAELAAPSEPNVLLIDGASYTESGVDVKVLRDELAQLGYSVRPVRVALGGANHFERYRMYEDLGGSVRAAPGAGQRWIFLAEIHANYDKVPLEQFERNADTSRAYHYLTASNAFYAELALRSGHGVRPSTLAQDWMVLRHALVNTFNAGLAARLVPEGKIRAANGRVHGSGKARYPYDAAKLLAEARSPHPTGPVPDWLFDIREPRVRALLGQNVGWVYFGVPGTRVGQLRYIRSLCARTAAPCIAPDPALIGALGSATHWRNAGHLSAKGARVYTAWLAHELDRLGLLQR